MQPRPHARIVVEQPGWDAHRREIRGLAGNHRAAGPAELAKTARRGFVSVDVVLAGQPAEFVLFDMDVSRDARRRELAAIHAMTVGHRPRGLDLEPNTAAGATPFDHRGPP